MKIFKNKPFLLFLFLFSCFSYHAQSQIKQDTRIDTLIAKKRSYNKIHQKGFRIQLYNGNEQTFLKVKQRFQKEFPEIPTHDKYEKPEWKAQVGKYKTRLEADKALNLIKLKFPGARVVPL